MALGILLIMNIIVFLGVVIAQVFLYIDRASNKFFVINIVLAILIALLVFTSLPTNYTAQRMIALTLGALSLIAYYLKTQDKNDFLSRILVSIAIFGNLVQLFI